MVKIAQDINGGVGGNASRYSSGYTLSSLTGGLMPFKDEKGIEGICFFCGQKITLNNKFYVICESCLYDLRENNLNHWILVERFFKITYLSSKPQNAIKMYDQGVCFLQKIGATTKLTNLTDSTFNLILNTSLKCL